MSKENRSAEGDVKKRLELRIQKRIGMMDTYYQQLAKTLVWSKELGVDVQLEVDDGIHRIVFGGLTGQEV